jgi:Ca-activated chloride channel family protein
MALLRLNGEGRLCLRSATGAEGSTETHLLKDVLLLIDVSGSMSGEKIMQAKQGAIGFARSAYKRGCATALGVFGSEAAIVCDPTLDSVAFENKVSELTINGSTNLAAGLELAGKFTHLNAVVVVTDGQPDSQSDALHAAKSLKQKGVDILCIGTDDADTSFLAKLATRSDLAIHVEAQDLRASIEQASTLLLGSGQ